MRPFFPLLPPFPLRNILFDEFSLITPRPARTRESRCDPLNRQFRFWTRKRFLTQRIACRLLQQRPPRPLLMAFFFFCERAVFLGMIVLFQAANSVRRRLACFRPSSKLFGRLDVKRPLLSHFRSGRLSTSNLYGHPFLRGSAPLFRFRWPPERSLVHSFPKLSSAIPQLGRTFSFHWPHPSMAISTSSIFCIDEHAFGAHSLWRSGAQIRITARFPREIPAAGRFYRINRACSAARAFPSEGRELPPRWLRALIRQAKVARPHWPLPMLECLTFPRLSLHKRGGDGQTPRSSFSGKEFPEIRDCSFGRPRFFRRRSLVCLAIPSLTS